MGIRDFFRRRTTRELLAEIMANDRDKDDIIAEKDEKIADLEVQLSTALSDVAESRKLVLHQAKFISRDELANKIAAVQPRPQIPNQPAPTPPHRVSVIPQQRIANNGAAA